jgi:hypothetical protein
LEHGNKNNEWQTTPGQVEELLKWGGAAAPMLRGANTLDELNTYRPTDEKSRVTPVGYECAGTSESFLQQYGYLVDAIDHVKVVAGPYPHAIGIGYASDFDGLAGWPMARFTEGQDPPSFGDAIADWISGMFVGSHPPVGQCYSAKSGTSTKPRVVYPIDSPMTPDNDRIPPSVLDWTGRTRPYDISYDGFAHVGMLPDFMEELRVLLDLPSADAGELEPLWYGAEQYIRTWEAAEAYQGQFVHEEHPEECRTLRAELLKTAGTSAGDRPVTLANWTAAIKGMRELACFGMD